MTKTCIGLTLIALLMTTPVRTAYAAEPANEDGFVSIFNGKDLTGWKGLAGHWSVEDGALTGVNTNENPLKKNSFLVWQDGKVGDFELRFSYKIVGGNSGVQYRSKLIDPNEFVVQGYQADIDSSPRFTGMNYEEGGRAFLAQRGERLTIAADGKKNLETFADKDELQKKIKVEDWNDYVIIAKGQNLKHYVNGQLLSEVTDEESGKSATEGILAIQLHSGPPMKVQLKNVRLKSLK